MQRFVTGFFLVTASAIAFAQAPFTIVRPVEGATVRETVDIVMPKGSVPEGGFIAVQVDGKFLEATVPQLDKAKDALVYKLDTKAKGIADGKHTIALILYVVQNNRSIVADRSEVSVVVGNHAGIKVPEDGLLLQYRWRRGAEHAYNVSIGYDIATLTEALNRMGGRAAQIPLMQENLRLLYAVDDVKSGNLGLIRTQLLPYRGKDYAVFTASGDSAPKKHYEHRFWPVYHLLRPNGLEVYSDVPVVIELGGSTGTVPEANIFPFLPLPVLPTSKLNVGDSWQANIAMPGSNIEKTRQDGKAFTMYQARGTFEAVEWERSRPCAKLKYEISFAEGSKDTPTLEVAGREFRNNQRQRIQQIVWLDLERGVMIRSDLTIEGDLKLEAPSQTGAGTAGGAGGGPSRAGAATSGGGGGGSAGTRIDYAGQRGGPARSGTRASGESDEDERPARGTRGAPGGGRSDAGIFVRTKLYVKALLEQ